MIQLINMIIIYKPILRSLRNLERGLNPDPLLDTALLNSYLRDTHVTCHVSNTAGNSLSQSNE